MICPNCGADAGNALFCTNCGTRMPSASSGPASPNPGQTYSSSGTYSRPGASGYSADGYSASSGAAYSSNSGGYAPQTPPAYNNYANIDPESLPPQFRPLSAWAYFGLSILFSIPIVGFILLIVFSFSNENINRRNYARSYFCVLLLVVIVFVIISIIVGIDNIPAILYQIRR